MFGSGTAPNAKHRSAQMNCVVAKRTVAQCMSGPETPAHRGKLGGAAVTKSFATTSASHYGKRRGSSLALGWIETVWLTVHRFS